jgi:myomegalin
MGTLQNHLLPKCVFSGPGSSSHFCSQGLESTPQVYNENIDLKEENQTLQAQLNHIFRGG